MTKPLTDPENSSAKVASPPGRRDDEKRRSGGLDPARRALHVLALLTAS
jgi:hypothetical protein